MKTMILAAAAVLSIGVGAAYAGDGEDSGTVPNTYFSELPGVTAQLGTQPNDVAVNTTPTTVQNNAAVTQAMPQNTTVTTTNGG